VPVLLMAPPFQIQGVYAVQRNADVTQALRLASQGFFIVKQTRVFDADGAPLGEGETIIVNGAALQMMSATRQHISVVNSVPVARPAADAAESEPSPALKDVNRAA
jgi:hypothetical protein